MIFCQQLPPFHLSMPVPTLQHIALHTTPEHFWCRKLFSYTILFQFTNFHLRMRLPMQRCEYFICLFTIVTNCKHTPSDSNIYKYMPCAFQHTYSVSCAATSATTYWVNVQLPLPHNMCTFVYLDISVYTLQ